MRALLLAVGLRHEPSYTRLHVRQDFTTPKLLFRAIAYENVVDMWGDVNSWLQIVDEEVHVLPLLARHRSFSPAGLRLPISS